MIFMAVFLLAATAQAGQVFPDITMSGKLSDAQKTYLGVSSDTFTLSDIKGGYLFVEAYSMYCPVCQRDAPRLNEIYDAVTKADTEGSVKFIGIGLGNTEFEVAFYQNKYDVQFPLVVDENYVIHKALGEVATPTFYIVKLGSSPEILYMKEGEAEDKDLLLEVIMEKTGLK